MLRYPKPRDGVLLVSHLKQPIFTEYIIVIVIVRIIFWPAVHFEKGQNQVYEDIFLMFSLLVTRISLNIEPFTTAQIVFLLHIDGKTG